MALCALDAFLGFTDVFEAAMSWLFWSWGDGKESGLPPVFLTTAGYYGTLAAVRSLGRAGIPVTVADSDNVVVSKFSRYTTTRLRCPGLREEGDAFIDWLLAFGKKASVKHVLLPTCDDTAWLYSRHQEALSKVFHLDRVPMDAMYTLLNKRRLTDACVEAGIDVPVTRGVDSERDVLRIAKEATFPILIKPTTQVLFKSREKGEIVNSRERFVERYRTFAARDYSPSLVAYDPSAMWPIVQEFYAGAADCIYNLSGFIDETGTATAFRASTKVLQLRKIGTGVCFEAAEAHPELTSAVTRLFRSVGYRGIFEIEFIRSEGRYMLIDANPRFYGEMAFEVERGMPLPLFAYYQALGDKDALRSLARTSKERSTREPLAHAHRFGFQMLLRLQRLAGAFTADDENEWRTWQKQVGERCSDAVVDDDDVVPSFVDAALVLYNYIRYPTELLKTTVEHRLGNGVRAPKNGAHPTRLVRVPDAPPSVRSPDIAT